MLVIFTALFLAQMFFHIFKGISPLQVPTIKQKSILVEYENEKSLIFSVLVRPTKASPTERW